MFEHNTKRSLKNFFLKNTQRIVHSLSFQFVYILSLISFRLHLIFEGFFLNASGQELKDITSLVNLFQE